MTDFNERGDEIITLTDVISGKSISKLLVEAITISDSPSKDITLLTLTESLTMTSLLTKSMTRELDLESLTVSDGITGPPIYGSETVFDGFKVYQGEMHEVMNNLAANKIPAHRIIAMYYDTDLSTTLAIIKI